MGSSTGLRLATELTGDLRCVRCGYNLRGLSVRDECPECGVAVRATILALVDPLADELQPLERPVRTTVGLCAWAWGGFACVALVWALVILDVLSAWLQRPIEAGWARPLCWIAVGASAIGCFALVRPTERLAKPFRRQALLGALAYLPVVPLAVYLIGQSGIGSGRSLAGTVGESGVGPALLRLLAIGCTVGMLLGIRNSLTHLLHRSALVRTGRIDTQPLNALLLTLAIMAAGDLSGLAGLLVRGAAGDVLIVVDVVARAVGGFLLAMGLLSLSVDVWRLRGALLYGPLGLADIFSEDGPNEAAAGESP